MVRVWSACLFLSKNGPHMNALQPTQAGNQFINTSGSSTNYCHRNYGTKQPTFSAMNNSLYLDAIPIENTRPKPFLWKAIPESRTASPPVSTQSNIQVIGVNGGLLTYK